MTEFDVDVELGVSFKDWKTKDKIKLIKEIIKGGDWVFYGETTVCIEPVDFP